MTPQEELRAAKDGLAALERQIFAFRAFQRARIARYVCLDEDRQQAFYTDEDGVISIKQDAPFVCEGVMVSGNDMADVTTPNSFEVYFQDMSAPRNVTNGFTTDLTLPASGILPSVTVPIEAFVPMYRAGDSGTVNPRNVDYWYTLPVQQVIPRGTTFRVLFTPMPSSVTPPNVTLVGYKLFS